MRLCINLLTAVLLSFSFADARVVHQFHVIGDDPGAWPQILSSIGLTSGAPDVTVVRQGESAPPAQWLGRIEQGALVVLEGDSDLARALGFRATPQRVVVRSVVDEFAPGLPVIWEKPVEAVRCDVPEQARVFARERWQGAPLVAGFRRGAGAVLWLATPPGERGYERFPYLLQALAALGLDPPLESRRLWAFFDTAYRSRADVEYLAERWRRAGICALHVAAWQHFEPDPQRDEYLRRLIEACHKNAILVYAWLELPHVSEKFWADHPEWREKTALGLDAHLDWRKLMNLSDPACFREIAEGVGSLLGRFDWDGVNLAELYFESLEGAANLARFTPFNRTVQAEFRGTHQAAPLDKLPQFLEYRVELAHRMQRQWLAELESTRRAKPHLDLVLTHIDDRFDTRMRAALGADAARVLPLLGEHNFTFLIEDPATIWDLGPQRYPQIWEKYQPLTKRPEKLAIDINIVERYQDVYPTKQQTGTELFQLVHLAAKSFPRVALYFENSILTQDAGLLPAAAARASRLERIGSRLAVESSHGVGVRWHGNALVDGRLWPASDGSTVLLPPGPHVIEAAGRQPELRVLDFNGTLRTASALSTGIEFSYESSSAAIAVLDRKPATVEVDGERVQLNTTPKVSASDADPLPYGRGTVSRPDPLPDGRGTVSRQCRDRKGAGAQLLTTLCLKMLENQGRHILMLPRGQHLVKIESTGP